MCLGISSFMYIFAAQSMDRLASSPLIDGVKTGEEAVDGGWGMALID